MTLVCKAKLVFTQVFIVYHKCLPIFGLSMQLSLSYVSEIQV